MSVKPPPAVVQIPPFSLKTIILFFPFWLSSCFRGERGKCLRWEQCSSLRKFHFCFSLYLETLKFLGSWRVLWRDVGGVVRPTKISWEQRRSSFFCFNSVVSLIFCSHSDVLVFFDQVGGEGSPKRIDECSEKVDQVSPLKRVLAILDADFFNDSKVILMGLLA